MATRLTEAHIRGEARLREAARIAMTEIWDGLGSYDREDVDRFLEQALPLVNGVRRSSMNLTAAYLARFSGAAPDVDEAAILGGIRNGVPAEEVYHRPFVDVWTGLKHGKPWVDAVDLGLERAVSAVAMDAQLAMSHTARSVGQRDGIYGYQRVTNSGACDLCLVASTQRYHTDQLLPIHNFCGCSVAPLLEPTGQIINRGRYDEMKSSGRSDALYRQRRAGEFQKRAAANQSRADLWRQRSEAATDEAAAVRYHDRSLQWQRRADQQAQEAERIRSAADKTVTVEVREHGELGPLLTNADHEFNLLR